MNDALNQHPSPCARLIGRRAEANGWTARLEGDAIEVAGSFVTADGCAWQERTVRHRLGGEGEEAFDRRRAEEAFELCRAADRREES
jgi:hypothetical protein